MARAGGRLSLLSTGCDASSLPGEVETKVEIINTQFM